MIPALAHIPDSTPRRRASRSLARRTADAIGAAVAEVLVNSEVAARPGLLQRIDPRVKLISIVGFAVTASFVHSVSALSAMIVLTLVLAAASRVSPVSFVRKVMASAGLFAVLLAAPAATAWITPGHAAMTLGPLTVTSEGLYIAVRLIARVVAGAGFGLLVVWTTRWTDLLRALTAMKMPDLVVATLAMAQQQIMSLLRTVENMHLARESRMLSRGTARENRGWVTERMAFVAKKSFKTADDVYDAMLARGFAGAMPSLVRLKTAPRDWFWLSGCTLTVALLLVADKMGNLR